MDRARHARAKAKGIPYGGRDPKARRRAGRKRRRRCSEARKAAGLVHPLRQRPDWTSCEERDRDSYARNVAVRGRDGRDIDAWLVAAGWALAYRQH